MRFVLRLAEDAIPQGELPIAAAIFHGDELISSAYTTERADGRWLVHAELKALLDADMKKLPFDIRVNLELYTNLEPCIMCLGAAMSCFIGHVVYSLEAPEDGAVELVRREYERRQITGLAGYHMPKITMGLLREESRQLFRRFAELNTGKPGVDFALSLANIL
jgi:tRNA(adenine34) deaminase